jgi:hypothetical protein
MTGLMEPYEATLAKFSFANDQSFRGNILEAQRQRFRDSHPRRGE